MIADRYSLDREIGRGGMGSVWLGRDEVLGRQVALKRIGMSPGVSEPDLARAEREAKLAARVNHPHVVAVYDLVDDGDDQWLVMELVDGLDLAGLVRRDGPLSPDRAALLLGQAAEALAEAHAVGIVHRDVKPSNILVTDSGQVKLTDFGIAKAEADLSLTQTGLVTGSPAYLAPEVASGHIATDASDVWSLGATLYYALEGRPPYEVTDNVMGTMFRVVHEDPARPRNPGWLAPLMLATMAKDPGDRWSMRDVQNFLQRGPVVATPAQPAVNDDLTRVAAPAVLTGAGTFDATAESQATSVLPGARRRSRPRRSTPSWAAVVAVVVLVGAAVLVTALLVRGGDDDPPAADDATNGASTAASSSSSSPSSPSSSPTGTPSPSADAQRAAAMTAFVEDYLRTVLDDPAVSWERLTPAFQRASGGFGQYKKWWDSFEEAEILDIGADPNSMVVSYDVHYSRAGQGSFDDTVQLQLIEDGDSFLIAGEA